MFPFHPSSNIGHQQVSSITSSSKPSLGQDDKQPILDNSRAHHSGSQVGRDSELFESGVEHHHSGEHLPEAKFDPITTNYNPEVNMGRGISNIDKETVGKGTSRVFRGEPSADNERPPHFED